MFDHALPDLISESLIIYPKLTFLILTLMPRENSKNGLPDLWVSDVTTMRTKNCETPDTADQSLDL